MKTKEELAKEYALYNFDSGHLDIDDHFIAGYEAALSCFKEVPEQALLLNALMLLDNEGLKSLADSIYLRINKEDQCQDNPIT